MVNTVTDPVPWLSAVRTSHDRLAGLVSGLDADGLRSQSYDKDWTIAQVLSHLGSQAEIFSLFLDAGLTGGEPPAQGFGPIWDIWNARSPEEQAAESVTANEALISRVESLSPQQLAAFRLALFGTDLDAAGLLRMRLSEHALHTWDVAVALDPAARVAKDAVDLLIDGLPEMAARTGKQAAHPAVIAITATGPDRMFTLDTGGVSLSPGSVSLSPGDDGAASGSLELTVEALLRLVYGRLDDSALATGEIRTVNVSLPDLQAVFPGF
jgi:uncharacterized protein (TIGR03083 family)